VCIHVDDGNRTKLDLAHRLNSVRIRRAVNASDRARARSVCRYSIVPTFRLPTAPVRVTEAVVDPGSQYPNTGVEIRVGPIPLTRESSGVTKPLSETRRADPWTTLRVRRSPPIR
jgi:hypothetical protein